MSSLKDLASLIMVPSLYKDGELHTVKPLGNSILHPDATGNHDGTDGSTPSEGNFTFSRGSNLAATRVDVNGLIEKGRENHLLQSQSFDNASWDKTRNVVTANTATAPDGTNTADKIAVNATFSTNTSRVKQDISVSGLNTISLYAKADEITEMLLFELGNNNGIYFNLTSGSFVSYLNGTTNIIDYNIEDAGNDWYRYSITYSSSITRYAVYLSKSGSYVTDFTIGEGFYVWGGQIENGLVATDYIETGASTAQAGILEDMPRLDYSGGASCPALLLEPQRSNLYTYSEYYDSYTKSSCTITSNATTSPEGLQNASKIVSESGGPNIKRIQPSISTIGTNEYIISAFVKKAEWHYFFIYGAGTLVNGSLTIFNLDNGTIEQGSGHATIEAFGDDGWYKITWKATSTGTGTGDPRIGITNNPSSSNSTGDGISGVYLYGLQIEQGSYPTSYIPTYGSSVTRSYDVCKKTNIDSLIAEEGTAFIDVTNGDENEVNAFMTIADSSVYPDHIWIGQNGTTLSLYVKANDSYSLIANNIASVEGRKKIAVVYTNESIKVFVNGTNEYTANDKTLPSQLNRVELGAFNTSINTGTARYDQAVLFPTALTDRECIALTTI